MSSLKKLYPGTGITLTDNALTGDITIAAPTATATVGGIVPTPPNDVTTFFRGDATFTIPPSFAGSAVGYVPTSSGGTVNFLRADGNWAAPPGGSVGADSITGTTTLTLVGDVTTPGADTYYGYQSSARGFFQVPYASLSGLPTLPVALTSTVGGLTPNVTPNDATKVLRGDGAWGTLAYTSISGTPTQPVALTSTVGGLTPTVTPNSAAQVLLGSGIWGTLAYSALSGTPTQPVALTSTVGGLTPAVTPNSAAQVLLGSGVWGTLAYSALGSPPTLGTSAAKNIPASGNAAVGEVVYGTDTRLTDSRTPTTHATSHKSGGSDSIALDTLAVPTDITTLNATSLLHGLLVKVSGTATDFVGGDNACHAHSTVALDTLGACTDITTRNSSSSQHGLLVKVSGTATDFVGGDNACHAHTTVPLDTLGTPTDITTLNSTTSQHGLLPKLGGGSTNFLRADGTWSTPPGGAAGTPYITTSSAFTVPAINVTVNVTVASAADMIVGQTHVITDGTLYMIGRVTVIATLVITYSNQGGGGSVSGSMGGGHVYMASAIGAVTGTATDFHGGDNVFHAHSTVALDTLGACTDITTRNASSSQHGLLVKVSGTATDFVGGDNACHAHSTVALDTLGATTDITTLNASTTAHGLLKKLDNTATHYLDGTGGWSTPPGTGVTTSQSLTGTTALTLVNDTTTPVNGQFYGYTGSARGWFTPAFTTQLTSSFTIPAVGSPVTIAILASNWTAVGQTLFISDGTHFGFYEITTWTSTTSIAITNRGANGNTASGTTMANNSPVTLESPGLAVAGGTNMPGLLPAPNNTVTTFLNGQLGYTTPPSFAGSTVGYVPTSVGGTVNFLRADGSWALPPGTVGTLTTSDSITGGGAMSGNLTVLLVGDTVTPTNGQFYGYSGSARGWFAPPAATATTTGYVPTPPNNTTTFLRGDATFAAVSYASLTGAPVSDPFTTTTSSFVIPAAGSPVTIAITSASWPIVGQVIEINDGTHYGFFEITTVTSGVSIAVTNRGYNGNPISGTMATAASVLLTSPGQATSTQSGFVPTPSGTATDFFGGDAAFHAHSTVALDTLGACTDITTRNASSSQHGLLVKVSGTATDFVGGDNACHAHSTVALDTLGACTDITTRNASSSQHGLLVKVSGTATDFVGGDNACHAHSTVALDTHGATTDITTLNASTSAHGLLPKLDNTVTHFLNGQGGWTTPANTQYLTTANTFTVPALNVTVNVTVGANTDMVVGETHIITDGTLFMVGRITTIASLVITYNNQGAGGSVSGTMGAAHVYFGSGIGLISGTATDFLGGDNAFHAHSTVPLDTLGACTDITTRNATSSLHGLLVKVSGTATDFVGGDNACHAHSTVALDTLGACTDITTRNATSSLHGLLVKVSGTATDFVGGDNACHAHSTVALDTLGATTDITTLNASTSAHGLTPKLDNVVTHFLNGQGGWTTPAGGGGGTSYLTTSASFTVPAINVTVNVTVGAATDMVVGETHIITDGTLFMVGRITVIASLVITYSNQGSGGSVSGSMGAGHVYFGSGIGAITGTATDFHGGDNAFHAHSTVALDTLGATTDITTLNASTSAHGLLKKLDNVASHYMDGTGLWSNPDSTSQWKVWVAGLEGSPPATLYAVFGTSNNRPHLAFNDSATWGADFYGIVPWGATLANGVIIRLKWKSITTTSGSAVWNVSIERSNTAENSDSFDTVGAATTACSGTQHILVESAITLTTIDSMVAGDPYVLRVARIGANGSDSLVGDACLRFVSIESA